VTAVAIDYIITDSIVIPVLTQILLIFVTSTSTYSMCLHTTTIALNPTKDNLSMTLDMVSTIQTQEIGITGNISL